VNVRIGITSKLTLAFALLVVFPAVVLLVLTRDIAARRFRSEFDARVSSVAEQVEAEQARRGEVLVGRVAGLFEGTEAPQGDPTLLDRYLVELKNGPLSMARRRELIDALPPLAAASGLDLLKLIDHRGTVIAQSSLRGREGHKDQAALALCQAAKRRPAFTRERLSDGSGGAQEKLLLEACVEVTRYGDPIYVLGGDAFTAVDLQSLANQPGVSLALLERGAVKLGELGRGVGGSIPLFSHLEGKSENGRFQLALSVSDQNQQEAVAELTTSSIAVTAASVLAAWALGFIIARRLTRPLAELVRRTGEVARGELQGALPNGRRDEVGALIDSFNEMTRRLSESQERLKHAERIAAWQEIARRLAHEIKNPLFPIQMSVETLKKTFGRKDFAEIFEESTTAVLEEVERLKEIVSEFSKFARLPEPKFAPTEINGVVQGALRLCAAANQEAGVSVEVELAPGLQSLRADREQLTQVLLNLLLNAREATPSGGTITLRTARQGDEITLSIKDTGPGFSEETKAKLFTPYFTTKEKGTGLGLAIVHRIITSHGGRISAESPKGEGATFTLSFPVSPA
jgi:nitrogen fixation/metabolism regulation signal transduction histidine kinase